METWIIMIMEKFGYVGIFLLITVENIFPPIPSEVILTFGGFMTTYSNLTVIGVVWFATLGSLLGASILYGIGYLVNPHKIEKLIDRWGYLLRLRKEDIDKAQDWFIKHGNWTVFFCRFIPLIRSLISIPAGMARMRFSPFFFLTLLGTLIWNVILVSIGAAVGESWTSIVEIMDVYANFVYIGLAILLILGAAFFIKKKRI